VTEAIDVVVHCSQVDGVPQVTEVIAVEDQQTGPGATSFTVTELFARGGPDAPLAWTGALPVRAARPLAAAGYDLRSELEVGARTGVHEVGR
jgi:hypothetical protein